MRLVTPLAAGAIAACLASPAPAEPARVATWLSWDYRAFRGELAVANGWLQRARRLLDGLEPGPEHAWLAVREGAFAFLAEHDTTRARRLASTAARFASESIVAVWTPTRKTSSTTTTRFRR